jgi:hypothetical protein
MDGALQDTLLVQQIADIGTEVQEVIAKLKEDAENDLMAKEE